METTGNGGVSPRKEPVSRSRQEPRLRHPLNVDLPAQKFDLSVTFDASSGSVRKRSSAPRSSAACSIPWRAVAQKVLLSAWRIKMDTSTRFGSRGLQEIAARDNKTKNGSGGQNVQNEHLPPTVLHSVSPLCLALQYHRRLCQTQADGYARWFPLSGSLWNVNPLSPKGQTDTAVNTVRRSWNLYLRLRGFGVHPEDSPPLPVGSLTVVRNIDDKIITVAQSVDRDFTVINCCRHTVINGIFKNGLHEIQP